MSIIKLSMRMYLVLLHFWLWSPRTQSSVIYHIHGMNIAWNCRSGLIFGSKCSWALRELTWIYCQPVVRYGEISKKQVKNGVNGSFEHLILNLMLLQVVKIIIKCNYPDLSVKETSKFSRSCANEDDMYSGCKCNFRIIKIQVGKERQALLCPCPDKKGFSSLSEPIN